MKSKILNFFTMIIANIGAILIIPTTFIAFVFGVLVVLHVRAFIHGWNKASGLGVMGKSEVTEVQKIA